MPNSFLPTQLSLPSTNLPATQGSRDGPNLAMILYDKSQQPGCGDRWCNFLNSSTSWDLGVPPIAKPLPSSFNKSPCGCAMSLNGGCVVVGKPHLSYSFVASHPTVYEAARADWEKLSNGWNFSRRKTNVCIWRGWLFIPSYQSIYVRFWRCPEGAPKFPTKFLGTINVREMKGLIVHPWESSLGT